MINDVDNITHYNTNHRKFLLIFILFMTLLFGIIYFLKDRIPDINILIKMILFFVIISYLKNDKISLSDEALVFTYGYIPYLKIRRNYKFDKINRISVVSDSKGRMSIVEIEYVTRNGGCKMLKIMRGEISNFELFVDDLLKRDKAYKISL